MLRGILPDRESKIYSSVGQEQRRTHRKHRDQENWRKHKPRGTPYCPKVSQLQEVHPKPSIPIWPSIHNTTAIQLIQGLGLRREADPSICRNASAFPLFRLQSFDSQDGIVLPKSPLPILLRPQLIQADSGNEASPGG